MNQNKYTEPTNTLAVRQGARLEDEKCLNPEECCDDEADLLQDFMAFEDHLKSEEQGDGALMQSSPSDSPEDDFSSPQWKISPHSYSQDSLCRPTKLLRQEIMSPRKSFYSFAPSTSVSGSFLDGAPSPRKTPTASNFGIGNTPATISTVKSTSLLLHNLVHRDHRFSNLAASIEKTNVTRVKLLRQRMTKDIMPYQQTSSLMASNASPSANVIALPKHDNLLHSRIASSGHVVQASFSTPSTVSTKSLLRLSNFLNGNQKTLTPRLEESRSILKQHHTYDVIV